jgi:hypothetical protein
MTSVFKVDKVPLRLDFAGGWLDVPALCREEGRIVNVSIQPLHDVETLKESTLFGSGLGTSAAFRILTGTDAMAEELRVAGWQDPAVIVETGLCVWRSGPVPILDFKMNPDWLGGLMAIYHTGQAHRTADLVNVRRPYDQIFQAGQLAAYSILRHDLTGLIRSVGWSYQAQLAEGMGPLPEFARSKGKYCGSGWGGYAFYLFNTAADRHAAQQQEPRLTAVEPYMRTPQEMCATLESLPLVR